MYEHDPAGCASEPAYDPQRAAQFERLIETTAPALPMDCRCTCDRCTYARPRPACTPARRVEDAA
jgi:hypothetical protein